MRNKPVEQLYAGQKCPKNFHCKQARSYVKLSKNKLPLLAGFCRGLSKLRKYMARFGLEDDCLSRRCEKAEKTPECNVLIRRRIRCFGAFQVPVGCLSSFDPPNVLDVLTHTGLECCSRVDELTFC